MSALFALAVCDVLMVNMWTSEIGRYKAASVGLLKTIFEVNLKLFNERGKKKILFLLRDFNAVNNNLVALKKQIGATMSEIWGAISKPSTHAMLSVFDCFEFDFFTFAPRDFKPDEFKEDVVELRRRFAVSSDPSIHLFEGLNTDIPVDGIDTYYREIWTLIKSEKDLNIPTQKEMLANLRCNEIKLEILQSFRERIQDLRSRAGKSLIAEMSSVCAGLMEAALLAYDEKANTYHNEVYTRFREELGDMLLTELKEIFDLQIKLLKAESLAKFKAELAAQLEKGKPTTAFTTKVSAAKQTTLHYFQSVASSSYLPNSEWSSQPAQEELLEQIQEKVAAEVENQRTLLDASIKKAFSGDFTSKLNRVIDSGKDDNMWIALADLQVTVLDPLEPMVRGVVEGLGDSEEKIVEAVAGLRNRCLETVKGKVVKHNAQLVDVMTKRFNNWFQKDASSVPRNWERTDVEEVYKASRDDALKILDTFRYFKLSVRTDTPMDGSTEVTPGQDYEELITEEAYSDLKERFLANAEIAYRDAVNLKEHGYGGRGVPTWLWVILLILGWNEILWLLGSPFFFYPILFVISLLALSVAMGMGRIPLFVLRQLMERWGLPRLF